MLPNVASFLVTEDCNLRCKYCFEKHNPSKMTKDVARKGLEFLCHNAIKDKAREFSAMIFGGEPTLMPDIIEEIFRYGLELASKNNIRFTASIVTNATIFNSKTEKILREYRDKVDLSVQLSVDGIKEVQDMYRVTRGGKGSFGMVEQNIPKWKSLFADAMDRLNIHGCCNKKTLPYLYENYLFFREVWQIPRIWFMPIHSEDWDAEDVAIYREQLGKIVDYILADVKKTGTDAEVVNYAPIDRCLRPDIFPSAPCGAGKNFITITASGELFPCHQIYFNDPDKITKIGDIYTGIDELRRKVFVDYDNSDLSCANAKFDPECDAYQCYRCIGENWIQNGSIFSVVDQGGVRCAMSKVEREMQVKVRKELKSMGIFNKKTVYVQGNNPDNPACLCDSRGGDMPIPGTAQDIQSVGKCNSDKKCSQGDEDGETIAMALKMVLDKLDTLEKGQEYILKKII